jgi:sigma-B regulation protein RsbU (phosphoserine phosphatase)
MKVAAFSFRKPVTCHFGTIMLPAENPARLRTFQQLETRPWKLQLLDSNLNMTVQLWNVPLRFLIRRSVRYLLVSHGFRLIQAIVVLAGLAFILTGSRITVIDRYGSRADIVASIFVTFATTMLLAKLNQRAMTAIDRRFFREVYNAKQVLTELGEVIPTLSKTKQLVELVADKISDALHPENVTIFLDDEDTGAYVAAFSSDTSKAGVALPSRLRTVVLHYDEGLVNRLRNSMQLTSVELTDADFLPPGPQLESVGVLSERERRTLRAVRSALLIPIVTHGRLHGLISLGRRLSDLPYIKEDKLLLLVVANQIAAFIANMKTISRMAKEERVARELELASEVQRHLFPAAGLENDKLEIYGTCLPALGVGGDYYDYFEVGERGTGIAIADVAGKGIAAALLMSTVQASLRCQFISGTRSLVDIVSSMNRLLQRSSGEGSYATFFLAEFNELTRALTYVNAGHNPPMLVRGGVASQGEANEFLDGPAPTRSLSRKKVGTGLGLALSMSEPVVELLTAGGPIIGAFLNEPYEQETIQLHSGDILAVYTDGVTEAVNPGGVEFGEERLRSILVRSLRLSAQESAEKIITQVLEWQGKTAQHDDITLIVVKVK